MTHLFSDPILDVGSLKKLLDGFPDDAQIMLRTEYEETNIPLDCIKATIDEDGTEVTIEIDIPPVDLVAMGIDFNNVEPPKNADSLTKFGIRPE